MAKSKDTKRALLGSILSMIVCLAMLIGSTFAWFSDSVVSGNNKIVAGNLDVELEYTYTPNDEQSWQKVEERTNLFKPSDTTLWEPGHTEYVYLRIRNAGSLALKYNLGVNVYSDAKGNAEKMYINQKGNSFKLSEHLVFINKDGKDTITDRSELWIKDAQAEKEAMGKLNDLSKSGELESDGVKYVTLAVYMPTQVGNEANQSTTDQKANDKPTIFLGLNLVAGQTPSESDSFNTNYDEDADPVIVDSNQKFVEAVKQGGEVVLKNDIELSSTTAISKDTTIDLNGKTLTGANTKSVLNIVNADVTIKNGTIEAKPAPSQSVLYAGGDANLIVKNCTIKSNGNQSFAVCTNGANSLNSTIVIKNSTISAPTVNGAKGYALYAPAGNVTFKNCDVTGHVFISGGNVVLDGGTYTATGFNNQSKIWHVNDTATYVSNIGAGNAFTMGDSILIADRRSGYTLSSVTIRNITFNSQIILSDGSKANAYAIKYVDMNQIPGAQRVNYTIEDNIYNHRIDGADPTMFIDLSGNDIVD